MRISRRGRPDRETLERLLQPAPADLTAGAEPLARLLAAAAAPPRPGEFGGEDAALVAFRAARDGHPQPSRDGGRRRRRLAVGAGVWAAAIAATATAGVAVAAGAQLQDDDARPQPTTAVPATSSAAPSTTTVPDRPPASAAPGPGAQPSPRRTPAPSATGLCRAYLEKSGAERGKSLETPAFGALVKAAGGRERVTAYCERAVGAQPGSDKARPTPGQGHDDPHGRDPARTPGGGPDK